MIDNLLKFDASMFDLLFLERAYFGVNINRRVEPDCDGLGGEAKGEVQHFSPLRLIQLL